jgi:hypothetical protein
LTKIFSRGINHLRRHQNKWKKIWSRGEKENTVFPLHDLEILTRIYIGKSGAEEIEERLRNDRNLQALFTRLAAKCNE